RAVRGPKVTSPRGAFHGGGAVIMCGSRRAQANRLSLFLITVLVAACASPASRSVSTSRPSIAAAQPPTFAVQEAYGRPPLSFERNQGQAGPDVKYLSRGHGYALFLTSQDVIFRLEDERLQMTLLGARSDASVTGVDELP